MWSQHLQSGHLEVVDEIGIVTAIFHHKIY